MQVKRWVFGCSLAAALMALILYAPLSLLRGTFALAVLIGAWEWAVLAMGKMHWRRRLYYPAFMLLPLFYPGPGLESFPGREVLSVILVLAGLWWLLALGLVISYPRCRAWLNPRMVRLSAGFMVLLGFWAGVIWLLDFAAVGPAVDSLFGGLEPARGLLVFVLVTAAMTDVGGYFAGRAVGGPRLAPALSPGKTWAGLAGGLALALLVALVLASLAGVSLGAPLVLLVLTVAIAAVVGDLVESLFKRLAEVKDSGSLIPGHGGILDRIDSHTAAVPLFALLLMLFD